MRKSNRFTPRIGNNRFRRTKAKIVRLRKLQRIARKAGR